MSDPKDIENQAKKATDAAQAAASEVHVAVPAEDDPMLAAANLRLENTELKDKLLRTLAEMENLRRRAEREATEAKIYAVTSFARDMLTFADNLRRALDSVPAQARDEAGEPWKSFAEGIEVTERDFLSRLGKFGIKKLEPLGGKFDPNLHEAMFEVPSETAPNGTVVQVIEDGYAIGERVLRPAKVGVARNKPKAANADVSD